MLAVPSGFAVTFCTVVAGVPQSGTCVHVTSWPSWNAVVPTSGSSSHCPLTITAYSSGPAARASKRVAYQPPSTGVIGCPGRAHAFQLPITSICCGLLAGWYHTITEQERRGTADAGGLPWQAAASDTPRTEASSARAGRTRADVALRQAGAAAPAAQSA
jgi:hypothetical protein